MTKEEALETIENMLSACVTNPSYEKCAQALQIAREELETAIEAEKLLSNDEFKEMVKDAANKAGYEII